MRLLLAARRVAAVEKPASPAARRRVLGCTGPVGSRLRKVCCCYLTGILARARRLSPGLFGGGPGRGTALDGGLDPPDLGIRLLDMGCLVSRSRAVGDVILDVLHPSRRARAPPAPPFVVLGFFGAASCDIVDPTLVCRDWNHGRYCVGDTREGVVFNGPENPWRSLMPV